MVKLFKGNPRIINVGRIFSFVLSANYFFLINRDFHQLLPCLSLKFQIGLLSQMLTRSNETFSV